LITSRSVFSCARKSLRRAKLKLNPSCEQTGAAAAHAEKFPSISGSDLVKFLESVGYRVTRKRGSHVRLVSDSGLATTIPIHAHRQLPKGLLHSIIHELDLTRTDFFTMWACYEKS
jgi:predicted RNA binding protein YcfA (HicA-like mRNA interferase family)